MTSRMGRKVDAFLVIRRPQTGMHLKTDQAGALLPAPQWQWGRRWDLSFGKIRGINNWGNDRDKLAEPETQLNEIGDQIE
jgi:hypothetical protein